MRDLLFKIRENIRPLPIDIYIQPIFDLSTNQIVGGEILARGYTLDSIVPFKNIIEHLQHPDIMLNVGNHVINLFCAFYQQRKMGDLRFNLNVSHLQIQHQKFPAIIEKTLKNYHI
ncbi:MAG: EAL domain-containing protein, partial [Kluyvera sp.]|uniref:EAL domain-containing protein n=1 Tax=Kluyvera sp. TaxID=1538228 RepID=UPI003A868E8C